MLSFLQNIPSALVAAVVAVALTSGYTFLEMRITILLLALAIIILLSAIPLWQLGLLGNMNGFDASPRVGIVKRYSDRNGWGVISADEEEDPSEPTLSKKDTRKFGSRNDVRFYREDKQACRLKLGSTVSFNTVKDQDAPGWLRAVNIKVVTDDGSAPIHVVAEGADAKPSFFNGVPNSNTVISKPERKREPERFVIGSPTGAQAHALRLPNDAMSSASASASSGNVNSFSTQQLTLDLSCGTLQGLKLLVLEGQSPAGLLVVDRAERDAQLLCKPIDGPGIRAGDILVQVGDGCTAAWQMLQVLNKAADARGEIQVVVQPRPSSFEAVLHRTGPLWDKLGLSVGIDKKNPSYMVVRAVRDEGLTANWNRAHGNLRICIGDIIKQVNECHGSATGMNAEIQKSGEGSVLRLYITTPPHRPLRSAGQLPNTGNS